jgi:hypothetical protein
MNKLIKSFLFLIFSSLSIITIASCSKNKKDNEWKITEDDITSTIELKDEAIIENNNLKISIFDDKDIFNDKLEKKYVKVLDFDSKEKDLNDLDKYAVDFNFNKKNNKNIEIEIDDYKEADYTILINKKGMKDNIYGVSLVSLKQNDISYQDKYLELVSNDYYVEEDNPSFEIHYRNYEINDIDEMDFSDAFSDLEVSRVENEKTTNTIYIETKGAINNDNTFGKIILKKNFFKNLENDINLVSNVLLLGGIVKDIDVSDNSKFKINLKLINQIVNDNLELSDVALSIPKPIDNVYVDADDKSLITIEFNSDDNATINEKLDGKTIFIEGDKLSGNNDVLIKYSSYKESLSIIKLIDQDKLTIYLKAINASIEDEIFINASIENSNFAPKITKINDNYKIEFNLVGNFGTINGNISAEVTDIFGDFKEISVPFSIMHPSLSSSDTDIQKFNEDVIEAEVDSKAAFASATMFFLYAVQIGISFSDYGNPCAQISSIISILNFIGVSKGLIPSSPSIADVLRKLDVMDKKLDEINEKLDRLSETIKEESAAIQMGIDKALYVIYKNNFENFYNSSINELDSILRDYGNAYRNYLASKFRLIDSTSNLYMRINYCMEENDKGEEVKVVCEPSQINPLYSLNGKEIIDSIELNISGSYFAELYTLLNQKGYTDEFDEKLQAALDNYAKDHPGVDSKDIYNAIISETQSHVITVELSNKITNAFCNFARGVYSNGNSQLTNFFGMVESLYNFESEARLSIDSMRASLKNQLVVYGSFVALFSEYAENQINKDEVTTLIDDACAYIKACSGRKNNNYCYITKTNISSALLKLRMTAVYYNPGPGCQFNSYFTPLYVINENSEGLFDYFNNQAMVDQTALLKLRARFDILRTMNVDYVDKTFEQYLISLGILRDWNSLYQTFRSKNKGKDLPQDLTVITSYSGISSADDQGNNYVCTSNGWGDYFKVGSVYQYKSKDAEYWSGMEARGTIFTFKNMTSYGNVIARYARYDESHWYWRTDEHHAFQMYSDGFLTLCFYKG